MLIQSHSGMNGYGYGYGEASTLVLVKGKDFNCKGSSCYGIGADRHKMFETLQTQLNVLATPVGYASLRVDGLLGPNTAQAAQLAAKAILASGLPSTEFPSVAAVAAGANSEQLAALVADFNLALAAASNIIVAQRAQAGLPSSPVIPPTRTQPAMTADQMPQLPSGVPLTTDALATKTPFKSKTLWWIAGGLATVAVVGGVGYVVYRRKARGY